MYFRRGATGEGEWGEEEKKEERVDGQSIKEKKELVNQSISIVQFNHDQLSDRRRGHARHQKEPNHGMDQGRSRHLREKGR